jgi:hypothetical protein
MDTHGHEEICKVGTELLKEAFGKLIGPRDKNVSAYHLGNWLTDWSQIYDEITYQKPARWAEQAAGLADELAEYLLNCCLVRVDDGSANLAFLAKAKKIAAEKWNETVADALAAALKDLAEYIRELTVALLGRGDDQADVAQGVKHLIRVLAYVKFVQDGGMDYDSFRNAFHQIMGPIDPVSGEPESKYGLRGAYYPHHHMDRWEGDQTPYRTESTRAQTRQETRDPDIYPYLRDHIEYAAGLLADLDLNWAEPTFDRRVWRKEPDNEAEGNETRLPPYAQWTPEQWKKWEIAMDERLALLGHAIHVIEDFFAHSTFVEHAFRLWNDPKTRPLWEHLGKRVFNYFLGNRDYTKFSRRLLKLDPAMLKDDPNGKTSYEKLNETPTNADGSSVEDPNVVTGYFDIRDTIISLEHVAMEMFGSKLIEWKVNKELNAGKSDDQKVKYSYKHSQQPSRYIRQAAEWIERPREAFADAGNKIKEDTKKKLEDLQKQWGQIRKLPEFQVPLETARCVARDVLPPDTPPEIVESLAKGLVAVEKGKVVMGAVASVKSAIEFFSVIGKGFKGIQEWIGKWLINHGISIVVNQMVAASENVVKDWVGANRIGCHSLIAKDHDYDYLNDGAINCAKFVDWYVLSHLLRLVDKEELLVCRSPAEGPGGPSLGRNVCNEYPWIDWVELLEHFLRHPGGTPVQDAHFSLPGEIVHITVDGDSLASLGLRYAATAHPDRKPARADQFWKRIAELNYDTSVPREINAFLRRAGVSYTVSDKVNEAWKAGTRVRIPDQPLQVAVWREPELHYKWFYKVLEHGYERARQGYRDDEYLQSVPGGVVHVPMPIRKPQMYNIRQNGQAQGETWIERYLTAGLEARRRGNPRVPPRPAKPAADPATQDDLQPTGGR